MSKPAVSVIIGTCQGAGTIGAALRSLARQTLAFDHFEVVVVLNGPPDCTSEVLAEIRTLYPRLVVRSLVYDTPGLGRARNAGMAMARGDYVTFVDDDDTVSPGYLEALLACSGSDVVGVAYMADVNGTGGAPDFSVTPRVPQLTCAGRTLMPGEVPVALSYSVGKMLPTALARAVGFDPDLRSGEDLIFYMRFFATFPLTVRFCPIEANAVYYRDLVPNSMARQSPSYDFSVTQRLDVIERLEALWPLAPWQAGTMSYMTVGQTRFINQFLRQNPDRHAEVLSDIRRRGLTSVPFDKLNANVARDLAVLYAALPFADTSANIAARRVRRAGLLVDVVAADMSRVRGIDRSANLIWQEFVDELFQVPGKPSVGGEWGPVAAFCRRGLEHIEDRERIKGTYRSVYSRAMFPGSHLLAAWYKIRNPQVRWVAEFSDPQLHNSQGNARRSKGKPDEDLLAELRKGLVNQGFVPPDSSNIWEWAEVLPYALADSILFTNEHQRHFMLGYCNDEALVERALLRSTIMRHPKPPAELYHATQAPYELDPAFVHIGYFGVFYATRGLTEVVAALRSLAPEDRARLRFHVFTAKPEELAAEAHEVGLDGVLVANPYISFLDFLNLTTRLDLLLVNDARTLETHGINPYLPSKYSDYAGSGTRIWGIVEPGSRLSACPLDYTSALGDIEGAEAVLRQVLDGATSGRRADVAVRPRLTGADGGQVQRRAAG